MTSLREVFFASSLLLTPFAQTTASELSWWKGNLHTHSLWSDGDDYPEMIADWYKRNGYHFLALSDHNITQVGQRWTTLPAGAPVSVAGYVEYEGGGAVLDRYIERFGTNWVEQRERDGKKEVRLKPLSEFRALLEEPGKFLLIPSEEMSTEWKQPKKRSRPERGGPVHLNVTNLHEYIKPAPGKDALTTMQQNVDLVLAQRARTGQAMFPHINHPNYRWSITAEELMRLKGEQFFEIYNGHTGVHNAGDHAHVGVETMWDIILTHRLTELRLDPMFGIAVDDAHDYHGNRPGKQYPGRGWVMVRARALTPESIVHAMEAGDFYSSTGVVLRDVQRGDGRLAIQIEGEPGITYTTQFIGTRRNYDRRSELLPLNTSDPIAAKGLQHRKYSADVGAILAEVQGLSATYQLKGDEIYVRAKIISNKPKQNGSAPDEVEVAWSQPLVGAKP